MSGTVEILSVGEGDIKLSFNSSDPADTIRAQRIVTDMLKRGYALLIEVDGRFQRVQQFDAEHNEYIIADYDPTVSTPDEKTEQGEETSSATEEAKPRRGRPRGTTTRRVPAESTRAIGVSRSAGG